jgi:hypothetical protein
MQRLGLSSVTLGLLLCATGIAIAAPSEWVQWDVSSGGNGHWYKPVAGFPGLNWTLADELAQMEGGYLATLTSPEENAFVFSLVADDPQYWNFCCNYSGAALGGLQQDGAPEPAGGWFWVTGEPWTYSNWNPGQPNNRPESDIPEERLHFFNPDGQWNDLGKLDFNLGGYVIERDTRFDHAFRLEKTFESNSTAEWSVSGTADWRIVSSARSHVFRQLRPDASARAVLNAFDGSDQSIQADVRIVELADASSWAGFLLRYTDLQNYYYLRVNRDSVKMRKIVGGVFQPVATAPLSLVLGRVYRFRIEAIGSRLRAFVNGQPVLDATDDAHASGRAGLSMFRARTDYDNVIVTSRPQTLLHADTFSETFSERQRPWTSAPANAWSIVPYTSGEHVYRQSRLTGTPRAVNGAPTGDQIVQAIVRPRAFNAGVNGWIGVMARHVDDSNHYYVALYRDKAALRKRVNGVHSTIKEVPFTVMLGVPYRLRLEAFGSSLRFYINDTLMAEGRDDTLPTGRYGFITFNAAADFDNFRALRP